MGLKLKQLRIENEYTLKYSVEIVFRSRCCDWQLHGYRFISNSTNLGSYLVHKIVKTVPLGISASADVTFLLI